MSLKITLNPNEEIVKEIRNKLKETNNYCPCSLIRNNDDYKCPCKAFREQITIGFCHCGLYQKVDDNT